MDFILLIVLIFAFLIIILSFIDLKISVVIYISYLILVPYLEFNIVGFSLSYNAVNTLIFLVLIYQSKIKKNFVLNYTVIIPFLFLYFSLLFLSLFTWVIPWSIQFNTWRASFMQTCIISFIIWNLALTNQKFLVYFKWAFFISISIAGVYGIFLLKMGGLNPYTSMLSNYFGKEDFAFYYSDSPVRLDFSTTAKIQATMAHPMAWSLVLSFSIIILSAIYLKTKNKMLWILIGLVGFNIFISGVRTCIAALTIGFIYFLIRNRNLKLIIYTLIGLLAITLVIQSNDSLSNLFASFANVSGQSEVSGSSITMRLNQLQGTLDEIKENKFVGKGYGWTGYFLSLNGVHPVILAFESLLFVILSNSGYLGLVIWIVFFLLLFRLNRKISNLKENIYLLDTLIITFIAYTMGTGEYGYLPFFAIFYTFLLGYLSKNEKYDSQCVQTIKCNDKRYVKFEVLN